MGAFSRTRTKVAEKQEAGRKVVARALARRPCAHVPRAHRAVQRPKKPIFLWVLGVRARVRVCVYVCVHA